MRQKVYRGISETQFSCSGSLLRKGKSKTFTLRATLARSTGEPPVATKERTASEAQLSTLSMRALKGETPGRLHEVNFGDARPLLLRAARNKTTTSYEGVTKDYHFV